MCEHQLPSLITINSNDYDATVIVYNPCSNVEEKTEWTTVNKDFSDIDQDTWIQ